jgi:hypothetical protein
MSLVEHLQKSFEAAENEQSKLIPDILELEGFSGNMTRHFYNNLLNREGMKYLEVGTWLGSTVCSAMYRNTATVVCIDNWSEFPVNGKSVKDIFLKNLETYKGSNTVNLIEADCFTVDVARLPKFNVYLYDGAHTQEDHRKALIHFYDCLEDEFIFICDDWNWPYVRNGTIEAVHQLGLEVVYSLERGCQNDDPIPIPYVYGKNSWWNGIWAAVLRKR